MSLPIQLLLFTIKGYTAGYKIKLFMRDKYTQYKQKKIKAMQIIHRCIMRWYQTKILKKGIVIIRNRKEGMEDIKTIVWWNPKIHFFWNAIYMGPMSVKNGQYIIGTGKLNITTESVLLLCEYTIQRDSSCIIQHLDSQDTIENFEKTIQSIYMLADMWNMEKILSICSEYIDTYIQNTLYKLHKTTSLFRLELFTHTNPILAEYIWTTNFTTGKSRETLGVAMGISIKNLGGFKKSQTLYDLKNYIYKKKCIHVGQNQILNKIPSHIWNQIDIAQRELNDAKNGRRVGYFGRYISSEEIDMATTKLNDAWKLVDKWIGQQNKLY